MLFVMARYTAQLPVLDRSTCRPPTVHAYSTPEQYMPSVHVLYTHLSVLHDSQPLVQCL